MGTRSFEFAKHFVRKGHDVTVLTGDAYLPPLAGERQGRFTRTGTIDGVRIIAVKHAYSNYMGYFRRVLAFLLFLFHSFWIALFLRRPDLVLATSTPLTVAIVALSLKWLKGVPFVFEVRDLWPEAPIQVGAIRSPWLIGGLRFLERLTYRQAVSVVGLSPGMVEGILQTGTPAQKVAMIPNCSDLDLFLAPADTRVELAQLRRRFGLSDQLVVLHGGAMGIANGLDYVVRAAILLQQWGEQDICFLFAGDGKMKPQLELMCQQHGLTNLIFTGPVPRKEMPLYLSICNLTITSFLPLPIFATNSPNKFFDSLAAGKPVIVNSAGWTKEIVESERIGFYVNPTDPAELAALLQSLKSDKETLAAMGLRARRLAEERFERGKLADQMERVLVAAYEQGRSIDAKGRIYAK
nr:glycosyltransferase family 4 protein [Brevibacillus fulvus]